MTTGVTFDEWAIDVTSWPFYCFVPICGDEIVLGMNMISDRSPGPLTAVISENGFDHAQEWADAHPAWQIDYANATDLTEATQP